MKPSFPKDKQQHKGIGTKGTLTTSGYHSCSKSKKRVEKGYDYSLMPTKYKDEVREKHSLSR